MTETELPANPIRGAIDMIKQYGWAQGRDGYPGVEMCARGAIMASLGGLREEDMMGRCGLPPTPRRRMFDEAMMRLMSSIYQLTGTPHDVVGYNDRYCGSSQQILRVMEHAATQWDTDHGLEAPPVEKPVAKPRQTAPVYRFEQYAPLNFDFMAYTLAMTISSEKTVASQHKELVNA
jgi:hypothetical protein